MYLLIILAIIILIPSLGIAYLYTNKKKAVVSLKEPLDWKKIYE